MELIPRKGKIRTPHFAHVSQAECATAGETALHRYAKEIIANGAPLLLPPVEIGSGYRTERLREAMEVTFDEVLLEPWQDGVRPDLVAVKRDSSGAASRRLYIEIVVTHRVTAEKLARLAERDVAVLEIDLSKVRRTLDGNELRQMILRGASRRWLLVGLLMPAQISSQRP